MPTDLLLAYRQIILHKRCVDPFEEPRIERLLSEVQTDEFILIGACTEDAVKATALGLLHRGRNVRVIADAVGSHTEKEAKLALRKMQAKGAKLVQTRDIAGVSHLRHVRTYACSRCWRKITKKTRKMGRERYRPAIKGKFKNSKKLHYDLKQSLTHR